MSKEAYIGVDIGTGGSRAVSYDLDLNLLDIAYQKHKTIHSKPNQVVQDPEEILIAVKRCLKKVASRKLNIKGIGFSSMLPSIVGYNKAGKPTTPLYTWADSQGARYVNELVENFPTFISGPGVYLIRCTRRSSCYTYGKKSGGYLNLPRYGAL